MSQNYSILEKLGIKGPNINVYAANTIQNNSEIIRKIGTKSTMSFIFCDNETHQLVVKLHDRLL